MALRRTLLRLVLGWLALEILSAVLLATWAAGR